MTGGGTPEPARDSVAHQNRKLRTAHQLGVLRPLLPPWPPRPRGARRECARRQETQLLPMVSRRAKHTGNLGGRELAGSPWGSGGPEEGGKMKRDQEGHVELVWSLPLPGRVAGGTAGSDSLKGSSFAFELSLRTLDQSV